MKNFIIFFLLSTVCLSQTFEENYALANNYYKDFELEKVDSILQQIQPSNLNEKILLCSLHEFNGNACIQNLYEKLNKNELNRISNKAKSLMYSHLSFNAMDLWNVKKSELYSDLALKYAKPLHQVVTFEEFYPYFCKVNQLYHYEKFGELRDMVESFKISPLFQNLQECNANNIRLKTLLGIVYAKESDFEQSIELQNDVVDCAEQNLDKTKGEIGLCYQNLGHANLSYGDYKNADVFLHKAFKIVDESEEDYHLHILYNLAWLHAELGNYELFEQYANMCYNQIIRELGKENSAFIMLNRMMIEQYINFGDYSKASKLANDLEEVQTSYYQTSISEHHAVLKNLLGKINEYKQNNHVAKQFYNQSIEIRDSLQEVSIYTIQSRWNLANLSYQMGDSTTAKKEIIKSFEYINKYPSKSYAFQLLKIDFNLLDLKLKKKKSIEDYLILLNDLDNRAINDNLRLKIYSEIIDFLIHTKAFYDAEKYAKKGLALIESESTIWYKNDENIRKNLIEVCKKLYYKIHLANDKSKGLENLFYLSELEKLFQIKSNLFKGYRNKMAYVPDSILSKEQKLMSEINFYRSRMHSMANYSIEIQSSFLKKLENYQNFKKKYSVLYPRFFELVKPEPISLDKLKSQLSEDENIVTFTWIENQLKAIVINQKNSNIIDLNYSDNLEIIEQLNAYENLTNLEVFKNLSNDLYQRIFLKISPHLVGKKIYWIPAHGLQTFNPEMLIKSTKGTSFSHLDYLLHYYQFAFHITATTAVPNQTIDRNKKKNFVGFAPVFDNLLKEDLAKHNQLDSNLIYLLKQPFAEKTLMHVSKLFNGKSYTRIDAKESLFKSQANKFKILHLATHTELNEASPMFSKIYLAPDSVDSNDGKLHIYEIYEKPLENDLVVLSSCDAAKGKKHYGNNPFISLSHSFVYAGSKNLIYTIFSVDEKTTQDILYKFYVNISGNSDYAYQLTQAKSNYIKNASSKLASPYYWGGIVIQSGINDDAANHISWIYWIFGGILILTILAYYFIKTKHSSNIT